MAVTHFVCVCVYWPVVLQPGCSTVTATAVLSGIPELRHLDHLLIVPEALKN